MCKERYIHPFTDFGFKRLFGTPQNKEFLIDFLNSLLKTESPITDLTYLNTAKIGIMPSDRAAIFDLYCVTDSGEHFIVEMQNAYQRYFIDRSIYYSTFPMHEAAIKGEWDFNLPKIYSVSFLNFSLQDFADTPQFRHTVKLIDQESDKVFYDKLTYYYIEIPKFTTYLEDTDDRFEQWVYALKHMNQLDELPPRLKDKVFQRFFQMAEVSTFSREEIRSYEDSLKHLRDHHNTINTAREIGFEQGRQEGHAAGLAEGRAEGRAKGRAEGRAEGVLDVARKMKAAGLPVDTVAKMTGLTPDEISRLE